MCLLSGGSKGSAPIRSVSATGKILSGGGGGILVRANPSDTLVKGYALDNDSDNLSLDSDFNLDVAVPAPLSM